MSFFRNRHPCFFRQGLSLAWSWLAKLGLMASEPQGATLFICIFSALGLQATILSFLYGVLGTGLRSSCLHSRHFISWAFFEEKLVIMTGKIIGGKLKADVGALPEMNERRVVRGRMVRRDGTRDGLTAGQGGDTGSKQNCLPSSLESELVYMMPWFPVSQASYFTVCLESMGACECKRKTCWAKSLPNRWVSSGNQGVSFNFHSHPSFTWVPVTRCKSFGRRIPQPLIRLWGSPSGLAAAASSFPGLRPLLSATPPSAWEPIPWPPVDDLWPRWTLKAQTWRLTTQNNKIYRWYLRVCPESSLHFLSAFILRFTASPVTSMLQRKPSASISSTLGLMDQNSADTSCMCGFQLCHIRTWCGFLLLLHQKAFLPSGDCRQDGMFLPV